MPIVRLFDHLVGAGEQRGRHLDAERLRGLEIDHQLELSTDGAKTAIRRFGEGYQLCTILSDARLMANAAPAAVREARGQMAQAGAKTY